MKKITCSKCKGTGEVSLPTVLAKTLQCLTAKPQTSLDVARRLRGVNLSAVSNRLKELVDMDLATRARDGKAYLYTATPQQ